MPRSVNEQDYAMKRNEIIEVAQRLIYSKGYEQMSIQDILDALQISKGAFYHYFASKQALLEGLLERTQQEGEQILLGFINSPDLSAIEKLQRFFDTIARWKTVRRDYLLAILQIWYLDQNAIVRHKIQSSMAKHVAPLLTRVIRQGVAEGALTTHFPEHAGSIALALLQGLGEQFGALILHSQAARSEKLREAQAILDAYTDAFEQILGLQPGTFHLMDAALLQEWFIDP